MDMYAYTQDLIRKIKPQKVNYKCNKCKDTGIIEVNSGKYTTYRECECVIQARNIRNIERAQYTELFRNKDFSNYIADDRGRQCLKMKCIEFTQQEDAKAIALLGNVGTGKTHLAVSVLKEEAKQGKTVNAINYAELTRKLSANATDITGYYNIMGRCVTVEVLLIDDLFKGDYSEANVKQIYELINGRYEKGKTTIITSEKTIGQLTDIDEAIATRIIEMAKKTYILDITKLENWRVI